MDKEKDIKTMSNNKNVSVSFYNSLPNSKPTLGTGSNIGNGQKVSYKKTSNILQAVFLITDNIDDSNVLKTSLRSEAILMLSHILSYGEASGIRHDVMMRMSLMKMRALLSTAGAIRLVRAEYISLLDTALIDLEAQLEEGLSAMTLNSVLSNQGHDIGVVNNTNHEAQRKSGISSKGHERNFPSVREQSMHPAIPKQTDRREAILELIKDKLRVTVKDAQSVIQGVSSKTLQRELLSMVAEGVLKKEGERRWSVYMIRTNGNGNGSNSGNGAENGAAH